MDERDVLKERKKAQPQIEIGPWIDSRSCGVGYLMNRSEWESGVGRTQVFEGEKGQDRRILERGLEREHSERQLMKS
jgi:hypothetical protein